MHQRPIRPDASGLEVQIGNGRAASGRALERAAHPDFHREVIAELAIELGSVIGALIGLGIDGEEAAKASALAGAEAAAAEGIHAFSAEDAWHVLEDIPNDSAAALILIEHNWAVPLRDAIARAGGFRISDAFISPLDLVEIGLVSAEDAQHLHQLETSAAARAS